MSEEWQKYLKEDDITCLICLNPITYLAHKDAYADVGRDLLVTWFANDRIVKEINVIKNHLTYYCNYIQSAIHAKKSNNMYSEASLLDFMKDSEESDRKYLKDLLEQSNNNTGIWKHAGIKMEAVYNKVRGDLLSDVSLSEILSDTYFESIMNDLKEDK